MLSELDLERELVDRSHTLYTKWRDCLECQYNCYLCSAHVRFFSSVMEVWAWTEGLEVFNDQIAGGLDAE